MRFSVLLVVLLAFTASAVAQNTTGSTGSTTGDDAATAATATTGCPACVCPDTATEGKQIANFGMIIAILVLAGIAVCCIGALVWAHRDRFDENNIMGASQLQMQPLRGTGGVQRPKRRAPAWA